MPLYIGPFGPGATPLPGSTGTIVTAPVITPAWTRFSLAQTGSTTTQRFNRAFGQDPTQSTINYVNVISRIQSQYPAFVVGTGNAVYIASHMTEAVP